MSTLQVPSRLYVRTLDTSETIQLGGFSLVRDIELTYIQALLYIKGVLPGGTERLRIKVCTDSAYTQVAYTSEWSSLSGVTPVPAGNWLGWLRFTFARENVSETSTYYLLLEPSNYTRSADTFYLSVAYDYPAPTNTQAGTTKYATAFHIYGYETLDYQGDS